jgi:hypothetical protein
MSFRRVLNRWQEIFLSHRGEMGLSSLIFYVTSAVIVISIPVTVILLRTNQEQITSASFSPVSFSSPPTMNIDIPTDPVTKGSVVTIKTVTTNTNWSILYYSADYPAFRHPFEQKNYMVVVGQGSTIPESYWTAQQSGYLLGVTFQLQGTYGEFKSGDLMCTWDGQLYLYKKKSVNVFENFIDANAKYEGTWDHLTTCQNTAMKHVIVE